MSLANVTTVDTFFEDTLQDRLDHPQTWKEMCEVTMTDSGVIRSSYLSTTPSTQQGNAGAAPTGTLTGVALQLYAETSEALSITTTRDLGIVVDAMVLAQSPWTKPAELFDRIGHLLNEYIESQVLGQGSNWTSFGVGDLNSVGPAADTTAITVTASNVDDIIRGLKRVIRVANGQAKMNENGIGIVWRPGDFELLEAFIQANGFMTADAVLKEGTVAGVRYMGVDHYFSNDFTTGVVFGGVKKIQRVGIGRQTYGKAHTIPFPASDTNNFFSGTAFYSRIDIGFLAPSGLKTLLFKINVA